MGVTGSSRYVLSGNAGAGIARGRNSDTATTVLACPQNYQALAFVLNPSPSRGQARSCFPRNSLVCCCRVPCRCETCDLLENKVGVAQMRNNWFRCWGTVSTVSKADLQIGPHAEKLLAQVSGSPPHDVCLLAFSAPSQPQFSVSSARPGRL